MEVDHRRPILEVGHREVEDAEREAGGQAGQPDGHHPGGQLSEGHPMAAEQAHGLVLAAETAIGEHPVQSVDMVLRLIEAFERSTAGPVFDEPPAAAGGS